MSHLGSNLPPSNPRGRKNLFFNSVDEKLSLEDWEKEDYPRQWVRVESNDDYIVYIDYAYCAVGLATTSSDKQIFAEGKFEIILDDIVVVDKDYYGTKKYIWK